MCKKLAVLALAIVAGGFLLSSTHFGKYARTAVNKAKVSLQRSVPLELQLDTVKDEVARLIPDMRKQISTIASETVAVQNLQQEVDTLRAAVDKKTEDIRAMSDELRKGETKTVSFRGVEYSTVRFQTRLAHELQAAKTCQDGLKAKEQLLEAKTKALKSATEQLASIRLQKEQLEVQIAEMEAQLKAIRVAQTKSEFHFDDSRLANIKDSLKDIRNQMRSQQVELDLTGKFEENDFTTEKKIKTKDQLQKEVNDFLGGESNDKSRVVNGAN
jgi:DNA repair exonuclease SbcCD ATPase subunit